MSKKAVFVTLADKNYLDYAKQVFAGAYFNAGWKGDYLLLAHDCSEKDVAWFKKKGILVYHCKPIFKSSGIYSGVGYSKFYLLGPYFKRWSVVIYADADVIIRASVNALLSTKKFSAVASTKLKYHFKKFDLFKRYKADADSFSSGMFVFNTKKLERKEFESAIEIIDKYQRTLIHPGDDQAIFNLLFYGRWKKLSPIFNLLSVSNNRWHLPKNKLNGIIIHELSIKPWQKKSIYNSEWNQIKERADQIDLGHIPHPRKWSFSKRLAQTIHLRIRDEDFRKHYFKLLDSVQSNLPKTFQILKKTKKFLIKQCQKKQFL